MQRHTKAQGLPVKGARRGVALAALLAIGGGPVAGETLGGFDCLIDPEGIAEVSTREEGILDALLVQRGDLVAAGQVIARLNRDVEQATVDLAEARAGLDAEIDELREGLAFAERERERIDRLSKAKAISATEKDKATSEAKRAALRLEQALEQQRIAELELERARRLLANRTVRSPLDGLVMERLMSPGESAENRPIIKIAKIDPLYVEIFVPVDHYGAIATGMIADVTPRYPGAASHRAEVVVVDQIIDAASNTFGVRLLLPNPDNRIPAGVRCDIRFADQAGP